jgi:hypothetical protein
MTMHDDTDLRAKFKTIAAADAAVTPELTSGHIDAWRTALRIQRRRTFRTGAIVGMAAGVVFALAIGLVLGVSTGYASAEDIIKSRGDTPLPPAPTLAALRNIPPLMFSCSNVPPARAAQLPETQQGVPIVDVPVPTTRSNVSHGGVLGVRQLPNGTVIVNDAGRRQVKLLDSALNLITVARDSVGGSATSYGSRRMPMIPYLGDSSLFVDYDAGSILLMGPTGQIARAIAPLTPSMIYGLTGPNSKGVDDKGRILFQASIGDDPRLGLDRVKIPDSSVLIRADLDARRADTLARLKSAGQHKLMGRIGDGPVRFYTEPVPLTDGWALLSDGTIAILRGRDYHIDWIHADGSTTSGPKLPFDWKRLTDEDKQRIIDSIKTATAARNATIPTGPPPAPAGGDAQQPGQRRQAAPGEAQRRFPMEYIAPELKDIFDFYPPIRLGSVMADLDGNLWILPTTTARSKAGELVYDVANPNGDFHRVRLPAGRSIAGFAKGGVVFLLAGDATNGFLLEKTKVPPPPKTRPR